MLAPMNADDCFPTSRFTFGNFNINDPLRVLIVCYADLVQNSFGSYCTWNVQDIYELIYMTHCETFSLWTVTM